MSFKVEEITTLFRLGESEPLTETFDNRSGS
jgi:hypothetical protein